MFSLNEPLREASTPVQRAVTLVDTADIEAAIRR